MSGHVYLVGAGPGDLGLITVKGLEKLRAADTVVYDALANLELLKECPGAEMIDVGKRSNRHTMTQTDINSLLVSLGKEGKNVVRLKGGDPFLFGRGAEEAAALREAGVGVSVIPGVSSSISVPELAGIPITHRDHSPMVTFVTGHEMDGKSQNLDWTRLADGRGTLVILMGMKNADTISRSLMEGGMSPSTSASITVNGSTKNEMTVVTTVGELSTAIKENGLEPPGIIVIGNVVTERARLGDLK